MTLTIAFCDEFFTECSGQLGLPANYCDVHTGGDTDAFYAYPYVPDGETRNIMYTWYGFASLLLCSNTTQGA